MPSRAMTTPIVRRPLPAMSSPSASKMRSTNSGGAIHDACCTSSHHPERGVRSLQERHRRHQADARRRPDVGDQDASALAGFGSRHDVDDQQHQRHGRRDLHQRAQRQRGGGGEFPIGGDEIDRRGDREHHQRVDVSPAHRVEQHHRVQPDERHGVGGLRGPDALHQLHDEPHRAQRRADRHRAEREDRRGERMEHRGDRGGEPHEHGAVDRGGLTPSRPDEPPEVVRGVVRRRVRRRGSRRTATRSARSRRS